MSVVNQVRYKEELILDFARRKSTLMPTVRTDTQDRGGSLVFLVGGDGGRGPVTRGSNGLIPPSDDSQAQVTLTFVEEHDLNEKTGFDLFRGQGDQIPFMRTNALAVMHRAQDARIITAIATGTVSLGAVGGPMTQAFANKISVTLANSDVGLDDGGNNIFTLLTPAAYAELMTITSFANSDYVNWGGESPMTEGMPQHGQWKYWMGINWAQHTGLTGKGTSSATCLSWHRNSIGYAHSTMGLVVETGEDKKQDTTWTRSTIYHAAVKLINVGIVKFTHDDTLVLA